MEHITKTARQAKAAAQSLSICTQNEKIYALNHIAQALTDNTQNIINANAKDIANAKAKGITSAMLDRLTLNEKRIADMAQGVYDVAKLPDPIGEVLGMTLRPNGLLIGKKRVPLGVIGIIYEARPNVTSDAVSLCLKTGNAVVLRGGSEAINSNKEIVNVIKSALKQTNIHPDSVMLIEDTSREGAQFMMSLNGLIDVLIPRGGANLIKSVVKNATIPVIETGVGNCHIYIDKYADLNMGSEIIFNAKTSRPAVCNAAESLLVHTDVAHEFLPKAYELLKTKNVKILGCEKTCEILTEATLATENDYYTEFLDYILSVKVVGNIEEAIAHINKYGTKHSEAIVTKDYANAKKFENEVDAACVYVNASTRFTDGNEFGFGAEIGISTQKLHARGPCGLNELTTIKYIIEGSGQIRV